jgi:putative inorganic carbon (HCO3(-)) transporter
VGSVDGDHEVSAVRPPVESDRAATSAMAAATVVRWIASVTPLDIGRAGLVLTLLATPLPSGALMNLGLAVALAGALLHVWSRGVGGRRLPAAVWLMVAFTGATAVSALTAIDPWCGFAGPGGLLRAVTGREEIPLWCGFRGLLDTTRSTLVFVLAVTLLDSERIRRTWLVALVAVTCFVTLSGLLEYALGHRTAGLFLRDVAIGHSNQTASYLVMALPVSLAVLMSAVFSGGARLLAWLTLGLGVLAVVLTQSLTAWAAGIVVTIVLGLRTASRRALLIASAVAVSIAVAVVVVGPVFEKFTAAWLAMSTGSRLSWWAGALRVIGDHPFFGIGPRNFILIDRATYDFQTSFHAHNLYLNIASEHGLVGLTLLLAAVAAVAGRLNETRAAIVNAVDRACWWAAACAVLAFGVLGLTTTPYHSRHAMLLWAIVGLLYSQFRDRTPRVRAA